MNKKLILGLILFSTVVFAQQSNVQEAMCDLQGMTQAMVSVMTMLSIIIALPLIAAGIVLYVKKKPMKKAGIALIIIGIGLPIVFIVIYLLIPVLLGALYGRGADMECYY